MRRLTSPDSWYVLMLADGLRVQFRREDDGSVVILHMYLQELIDRYFANAAEPQPVP